MLHYGNCGPSRLARAGGMAGINTAPSAGEARRTTGISRPQTLQIHLPHGDPARIRMAEITTGTGHETVTFEPARGWGL
jgi:hypothetical protein